MLYMEIITVCSYIHAERLVGRTFDSFNFKAGGRLYRVITRRLQDK
jgi:hypothetical protein